MVCLGKNACVGAGNCGCAENGEVRGEHISSGQWHMVAVALPSPLQPATICPQPTSHTPTQHSSQTRGWTRTASVEAMG